MRRALVAATLLLSACASLGGEPMGAHMTWRCDGGKQFQAAITSDGAARINANGTRYTLPHARSGSGARYASGGVVYWEHGGEATLTGAAGGPYAHCRR